MRIVFLMIGLVYFLLLVSCGSKQEKVMEGDKVTTSEADSGFVLNEGAYKSAGIRLGTIEKKTLAYEIQAQGLIQLLPQQTAMVSVMIPGSILDIHVDFGKKVEKNEVLATYTSHELLEIQQLYLNTKNQLEKVKIDFNRQQSLWEKQVISEKEFQQSLLDFNRAKADFKTSEAEVSLLNLDMDKLERGEISPSIPIVSPIRGRVEEINTSIGQFVNLGDPVFKVIDTSDPVLQIKVFEKDIHFIRTGQKVTFTIPGKESSRYSASVINLGSSVETESRVVHVQARIVSDSQDLFPGMFVSTIIHTHEEEVYALPSSAVITENDTNRYGFYTLDEPGSISYRFYPIQLECGLEEKQFIEVKPVYQLPENSRFVISGTYYLKSEKMKNQEE